MADYQDRKQGRTLRYQAEHGQKLLTCTACNGSGRYDHNGSPPCGGCGGTGKTRERLSAPERLLPWREALAQRTALRNARRAG